MASAGGAAGSQEQGTSVNAQLDQCYDCLDFIEKATCGLTAPVTGVIKLIIAAIQLVWCILYTVLCCAALMTVCCSSANDDKKAQNNTKIAPAQDGEHESTLIEVRTWGMEKRIAPDPTFTLGSRVEVRHRDGIYYAATLTDWNRGNGTWNIMWDTGDFSVCVSERDIREFSGTGVAK